MTCSCGNDHATPQHYYVTMVYDRQVVALVGPFTDHEAALVRVDAARRTAESLDPRAVFASFGTVGTALTYAVPGKLNTMLGL